MDYLAITCTHHENSIIRGLHLFAFHLPQPFAPKPPPGKIR